MQLKTNQLGFGASSLLLICLTLVVIGFVSYFVFRQIANENHTQQLALSHNQSESSAKTETTPPTSPALKTYCNSTIAACIKYPTAWAMESGFPGAFEDPTDTSVVSLIPGSGQDEAPNDAYIYSVTPLVVASESLDIVGYIVSNQPGYVVYESSYVASADIKVGTTKLIVDGNYAFSGKSGSVSLVSTPGPSGFAAITDMTQAEAWFSSPSAEAALKVLQSLYYE